MDTFLCCLFRFGDDETATFFATLFSHIAHRRGLALAGHDLYHGHLFIADNEIGVLFHAKVTSNPSPVPSWNNLETLTFHSAGISSAVFYEFPVYLPSW